MKKLVAMFLMFVLLLLSVSCSAQTEEKTIESIAEQTQSTEEEDPLVVCVSSRAFLQNTAIQSKVYNYVKPECDRIVFECLPDDDADREAYCQRIRIELMSGGGPDVFILESDLVSYNGLFSDVEKMKKLKLDVPQATELAYELKKQGVPLRNGILTTKELVEELCRLY